MRFDDKAVLLLRAALVGDMAAWEAWLDTDRLDSCTDHEAQMLPLAHRALAAHDSVVARGDALATHHRERWTLGSLILHDTLPALDVLDGLAADPVLLKGAAVMSTAYLDDLGVRPISDIDAIVAKHSRTDAKSALMEDGWRMATRDNGIVTWHSLNLRKGHMGSMDLHWQLLLFGRDDAGDAELRARAIDAELGGRRVRVLDPEGMVLVAAAHADPGELKWTIDVAAAIRRAGSKLDWEWLAEAARRRLVLRRVLENLENLATAVPELIDKTWLAPLRTARPSRLDAPSGDSEPPTRWRLLRRLMVARTHRAPWREKVTIPVSLVTQRLGRAIREFTQRRGC